MQLRGPRQFRLQLRPSPRSEAFSSVIESSEAVLNLIGGLRPFSDASEKVEAIFLSTMERYKVIFGCNLEVGCRCRTSIERFWVILEYN
jgi:hypothetical protein